MLNTRPLQLPERSLPIDPYLLGWWAGDGNSRDGLLTVGNGEAEEVARLLAERGHRVSHLAPPGRGNTALLRVEGLTTLLRQEGFVQGVERRGLPRKGLTYHKCVPEAYLFASEQQRRDLLAGLMDSDGTTRSSSNNCQFDTTTPALADAVYCLVVSLGWRATRSSKVARFNGKTCGMVHRVSFRPTEQVFRLARKAARLNLAVGQRTRHLARAIIAVEPVPSRPVRCIAVDSPSRLFLCGRQMVPTHNSWGLRYVLEQTCGRIQQFVLDREGEYASLRERFDYLLVGAQGELPAIPDQAHILARRLMELHVSAVLDLSDLVARQREPFVQRFLEGLRDLPQALWHPVLVAIDEIHLLAPEQGRGEALSKAAIVDLATLGRKRGQCLPAGQLIITERGFVPIEHVAVGDRVLTHMGRFRPVTQVMRRHYPWPLLSIRSAGIFMPTVATADHPVLVHRTHNNGAGTRVVQEREWLPACELVPGSRLTKDAVRTFGPTLSEAHDAGRLTVRYPPRDRAPVTERGRRRRLAHEAALPTTPAAMRVIGWYLAEGSITYRRHQRATYPSKVRFSLGAHEEEAIATLRADLAELGFRSYCCAVSQGTVNVGVSSRRLAELLSRKFGAGAANKVIPMDVLLLPAEKLAHLLAAYVAGDGSVLRQRPWQAAAGTVSLHLALSLRLLGDKLGYFSSVQRADPGGEDVICGRPCFRRPSYTVWFVGGPGGSSKRLDDGTACFTVRTVSEEPFAGTVYNLEVDEDQSYCTPGHVVHNCLIGATQRISRVSNDVLAELQNKLIGLTTLDTDKRRAADDLGFDRSRRDTLKTLEPGQFYAVGPAFSTRAVTLLRTGPVQTTHPEPGKVAPPAPPPPEAIRALLAQLRDLPAAAAEAQPTDLASARQRIAELERQVHERRVERVVERVEVPVIQPEELVQLQTLADRVGQLGAELGQLGMTIAEAVGRASSVEAHTLPVAALPQPALARRSRRRTHLVPTLLPARADESQGQGPRLALAERKILAALAQYPQGRTKTQVALLAGYAQSGGGFNNAVGALRSRGWISGPKERLEITEAGRAALGSWTPLPTGPALVEHWLGQLPKAERLILQALVKAAPQALTKQELATRTGYAASGGGFNNALGRLRTLELIVGSRELRASEVFFQEAPARRARRAARSRGQ